MGRHCSICTHFATAEILDAIASSGSIRAAARRHGVSERSLRRHLQPGHVPRLPRPAFSVAVRADDTAAVGARLAAHEAAVNAKVADLRRRQAAGGLGVRELLGLLGADLGDYAGVIEDGPAEHRIEQQRAEMRATALGGQRDDRDTTP